MSDHEQPTSDLAAQAGSLGSTAANIVDDLQQRFEQLRRWHGEAEQTLEARTADIVRREQRVEAGRVATRQHRDRLKGYRTQLGELRTEHRQRMADLEKDRSELDELKRRAERTLVELQDERTELRRLREEMDGEWANLTRLRRAQEAMAAALDTDRERINAQRFHLVGNTDEATDLPERRAA